MEYNIANIKDEGIEIINNAQQQIKMQTGDDVILVAYQKPCDKNDKM